MSHKLPFVLAVLLSLVVIYLPGSGVPGSPDGTDKLVHLGTFFLLALTGRIAGIPALWLGLALIAYAPISEVLQAVLPINRDGDPADALADSLGVLTGLVAGRLASVGR
ncbi:MAG TPA: VanZ family protein [Mycobacteriales bacterium]|nr:VanZ family protein [Mycobacteriales bacterium]